MQFRHVIPPARASAVTDTGVLAYTPKPPERQSGSRSSAGGKRRTGSVYCEHETDLFIGNRNRRFKIDGLLQQSIGGGVNFFAQLFADVDLRSGADAIQSYLCVSFDVGQVVGAIQGAVK
jgi:hypothetical protein